MPAMNFVLTGQDLLSRVMDRAGDASDRLGRRLLTMSINGDAAVRRFSNNATRNLSQLERDTKAGGKALSELKTASLLLAPAAIPVAASLAPIAAGAGTVAVAVAAMGVALGAQLGALGDASEAQKKYQEAVDKSGATSKEAAQAQAEYARTVAEMPPETRRAAAALGVLKDEYKDWSNSLAGDTMAPVTKTLQLTNALLPKTTGLVKSASGETDRFLTVLGGQMATPGFDQVNAKFTAFADRTMRRVNDELVHMLRTSDGEIGGNARDFLDWARAQGPAVASVLSSVSEALVHVLQAGSDVGVGLLQVIDVLAGVVSAVPPGAIALLLQLALALKLTKAAALGLVAGRTAVAGFAAQILAMNTAAAATPGRLAAVRAGVAALSRTTRLAMAGTGIGLLVIALSELSQRSGQAPPNVDKLTGSLKTLGATGKVTGEAAKHFGSDLSGLHDKVAALTDPSATDKVQQWIVSLGGLADWDSTPVKEAKENIDAIDKALAGLVSSGNADLAEAALKRLTAEYGKGGADTAEFTRQLGDYKSALADAKFESELAAEAQGVFGAQAQAVQQKLAGQKLSADGLRQSIQALSETSRSAFDAQTKFEAAIDNVTKTLQANGRTLDASTDKGRANREALSQMAAATEDAAAKARENGSSWQTVAGIYDKGRKTLVDNIAAITGNRREAQRLASQLLKMPDKKMRLEMRTEDAVKGLDRVTAAMKKTPGSKSVTVKALTSDAVGMLRDLGFKVQRMKDGRFKVTAETANAKANISAVQKARDALNSKTITLAARDRASAQARSIRAQIAAITGKTVTITTIRKTIAISNTSGRPVRGEGGVSKYAAGGAPEAGEYAMVGENGPELVLFGEAARVIDATRTKGIMRGALGAGQAATQGLAAGLGSTAGVYAAGRAMAAAVTRAIRDELEIRSPSKKTTALAKDIGKGLIVGLTGSRDKIRATARDLAKDIYAAFTGTKDNRLVAYVNAQTKTLLGLAGKRDAVEAAIKRAKDFAESTRVGAKKSASLSSMFEGDEPVTAAGIQQKLAAKLTKMKAFAAYVQTLAKRGLNKTMLREILEMGPEEGYAYASALAGANSAAFKAINSTQYAINAEAEKLGRSGADALYDSGKNASRGFLAGLTSQQKELEKTMEKIAKAMQKALRRALGIKSPARAMIPDGVNTVRGVAAGVLAGLPHVDRAMKTVAGRMAGKAATAPLPGRAAAVAAAGTTTVNFTVQAGFGTDPIALAQEMQRMLLRLKRDYGLNVNLGVS